MSFTKKQFIEAAYRELGVPDYTFDIGADEYQASVFRLDAMIADWKAAGLSISYPLPNAPLDSVITSLTTSPDAANKAIITNLAVELAPGIGKMVLPSTDKAAKKSYNTLLLKTTQDIQMQMPSTMPRGSGNKPWRSQKNNFFRTPTDDVQTGRGGDLELF